MFSATNLIRTGFLFQAIRFWAYGFVVVMGLLLSGCVKNDTGSGCRAGALEISPAISGGRITGNHFDPGDRVGLFVAVPAGIPDPDNYAYNLAYTYDGTRWTAPGGSPLPWPGTGRIDVYGYWPYDADLSAGNPRRYPFTAGTDQTTPEKYIRNDFLWARAGRQLPGQPVPLLFSHSMSRVRINITSSFDAGADWPQRARVALLGLSRQTTIDLVDGVADWEGARSSDAQPDEILLTGNAVVGHPPVPREEEDVIPLALDTPAPGYELSVAAIVIPQSYKAGLPLVKVTLDGEEYVFIPTADNYFPPGLSITVNLTLTEQPPGLVADLDQIDWDQSRVWNVYDGETVVAQVCREFLQPASSTGVQAAVVYPVSGGNIDFTAGYVARVFRWNANETSGYEIDPRSIHGGSVSFTSSVSYTQGTLPAVRKVVIDPAGITNTYDAAPPNLTVRAATVGDYDGNRYPVVKINRWYWTASNLRATRYMNGNGFVAWPYGNDPANTDTYGLLYTGYIAYAPQPLLPSPWHVPLEEECDAMHTYLSSQSGRKLKANRLWQSLGNSNDASGFSLLPGGLRDGNGVYSGIGTAAYWWTDTYNGFEGIYYTIDSNGDVVTKDMISHATSMSLRFLLTDPRALTGN